MRTDLLPKGCNILLSAAIAAALLTLTACCGMHQPQKHCHDRRLASREHFQNLLSDFNVAPWQQPPGERPVYCIAPTSGPAARAAANRPVLVLHEYDRLSANTLDFAKRLSKQGFTVYVPLLFGRPVGGSDFGTFVRNNLELATSRDWNVFMGGNQRQPIVSWLEQVSWRIANHHNGSGVAVIGMCLTGALPLAMMDQQCVIAPVVAQPSIPILCLTPGASSAPGISRTELSQAVQRARRDGVVVFGTRYEEDTISGKSKFCRIKKAFGDRHFRDSTIRAEHYLSGKWGLNEKAHPTLTHYFHDQSDPHSPPHWIFQELVTYLNEQFRRYSRN